MFVNIFYNRSEGRLRAFWRLVIQTAIFFLGNILLSLPIGIVAGILLASSGGNIADPGAANAILSHPLVRAGSAVASLVAMILSYWVAARWLDRRRWRDFGFHFSANWWKDFAFGLALGAVLMMLIFAVELAMGWVTITGVMQTFNSGVTFVEGILINLVVYFCVGIYEEMLSRGYHLRNMAEGLNLKPVGPRAALLLAYLISSSIFGLLHLGNPNATWTSTLNIIFAGIFLGLGFVLTGELAIPIGVHMTWNFFQGNVFGFPVSGMASKASFIGIQQSGPEAWTGGAFGPEAGYIGLAAIFLGCLLTVLWVRWRYGKASLLDRLALYHAPSSAHHAGLSEPEKPAEL